MKLFITQREEKNRYGKPIDSLEHSYLKYFQTWDINDFVIIPNNEESSDQIIKTITPSDFIVLTGGGNIGEQKNRDLVEKKLIELSMQQNTPLLGICRGMQTINSFFGGSLVHLIEYQPQAKQHDIIILDNDWIPTTAHGKVNSYHNFLVTANTLGKKLNVFAMSISTTTPNIECIVVPNRKIVGVQWHPERDRLSKWVDDIIMEHLLE